ncbi:MAG TPA: hypothetical protein VD884_18540 [Ohtaekwangia sp.]|nr:hypothetical protein [Ohtaekwangia sp.]
MKKGFTAISTLLAIGFIMIGANFKQQEEEAEVKIHCSGYTIIEAGLAVDCHGDTVKLIKRRGFFELASRHTETLTQELN